MVVTYTLHDGTGGGLAANYSLANGAATGQVTPKALTVSGITAASTIYDGTTTAKLGGTAALQPAETPGNGNPSDGKPYTVDAVRYFLRGSNIPKRPELSRYGRITAFNLCTSDDGVSFHKHASGTWDGFKA